ncbi:hypothetical protein H7J86_31775 [Mycobacterium hackensackense]|uniref:hypothetical protein n=1 Tax=Mycobacterium hackensackense TaxID=228909 RepID=UPI002265AE9C|nr:hypothetical protein [Mycobacterium hackensackense]MCV7256765.1 hypothetical protein [Mycobacterium hackensackense]
MSIPAGLVTRTMVLVRPVEGHVSVQDARTDLAVVALQWGDIFMRFTSAAQVSAVLAAFGAVREALRGAAGSATLKAVGADEWPGVSVVSVTWTRPPEWSVVNQSRYDQRRRCTVHWVDVHMGPVQWRVVDWAGYEAALTLLRNVHRTAVAVFPDGAKFRSDPSKVDAFTESAVAASVSA